MTLEGLVVPELAVLLELVELLKLSVLNNRCGTMITPAGRQCGSLLDRNYSITNGTVRQGFAAA